jgi:uncharacterized SAM-binding protein YcdF (DUF218 family)
MSNAQRFLAGFLGAILLAFSVVIAVPIIANFLLAHMQNPYRQGKVEWAKNNVIVVLGSGIDVYPDGHVDIGLTSQSRIRATAAAYKRCKKTQGHCTVLLSGGDSGNTGFSEAEIYHRYMNEFGVDGSDIVEEKESRNTWENAKYSVRLIKEQFNDSQVVLITSAFHMRRSLLYFSCFGVQAIPLVSDFLQSTSIFPPRYYSLDLIRTGLSEQAGILRCNVYRTLNI